MVHVSMKWFVTITCELWTQIYVSGHFSQCFKVFIHVAKSFFFKNPKGINYLIFFASIVALFSRSHSTFDFFFVDNTDSLFALFLILVNPIYVWDVFNVTNVTTFLFDGEIDVPKIGKSSSTFYNQYITPDGFPIFPKQANAYFEGQVPSKHKQIWAFLQSLE